MPEPTVPIHLTRSSVRASVGHTITGQSPHVDGFLVADVVDLTSSATLSAAGIPDHNQQRHILAQLWCDEDAEDTAAADEATDDLAAGAETVPAEELRALIDLALEDSEENDG
jgi:hypothetical protein